MLLGAPNLSWTKTGTQSKVMPQTIPPQANVAQKITTAGLMSCFKLLSLPPPAALALPFILSCFRAKIENRAQTANTMSDR